MIFTVIIFDNAFLQSLLHRSQAYLRRLSIPALLLCRTPRLFNCMFHKVKEGFMMDLHSKH